MTRTRALLCVILLQFGFLGFVAYEVFANQQADTTALCSLRTDIEQRVASSQNFLRTHPKGIPGVPIATIRISLSNARHTLHALRGLAGVCPVEQPTKKGP